MAKPGVDYHGWKSYPDSMSRSPMKRAFVAHKNRAKRSKTEFFFTFEEWVKWWEDQLGPDWLSKRGRRRGQFVMARKGDAGPYHPDNVYCSTFEQNVYAAGLRGIGAIGKYMVAAKKRLTD